MKSFAKNRANIKKKQPKPQLQHTAWALQLLLFMIVRSLPLSSAFWVVCLLNALLLLNRVTAEAQPHAQPSAAVQHTQRAQHGQTPRPTPRQTQPARPARPAPRPTQPVRPARPNPTPNTTPNPAAKPHATQPSAPSTAKPDAQPSQRPARPTPRPTQPARLARPNPTPNPAQRAQQGQIRAQPSPARPPVCPVYFFLR